jgi:2-keto-4-pentenoate hydratase/2-oxohepta-3-ene-1,7-dioic acid hydratase in catechol pathway
MRLVSFRRGGDVSYGTARDNHIREASECFRARYTDLRSVIEAGAYQQLREDTGGDEFVAAEVSLLPPISHPDKILCIGVNYRPHIAEMGRQVPDYPVVFVRFPGSLVGHEDPILRPSVSVQFDFEGELAVIIGKRARHVPRDSALDYVAGYCCFMDGSVRDWQRHTPQFTAGKNFHRSGAVGPAVVTTDEIPDPSLLQLRTSVNGELMQQGKLCDLVFDIPALIEYCSTFTELVPGDVIATGTPGGVGAARTPPKWLEPGDTVEVEIPGVGLLRSPVSDEAASLAP